MDPFEGDMPSKPEIDDSEGAEDSDMEMAIEDIEEDPPLLHVADSEE